MRLKLVLVAVVAAGCTSIDPSKHPGHYACVPDAGDAQQCPQGWECGFAGVCIDPASPQAYPCEADTDCVGGWHCGFGGTCLDPAVPKPYPCETQNQCAGGWRCGVNSVCYDVSLPGAWACDLGKNGNADCSPGWRCGLNSVCHDTDAGAAYGCVGPGGGADSYCEKGWRCGADGVCIDASQEALRVNAWGDGGAPGLVVIHPVLPPSPDHVESLWSEAQFCPIEDTAEYSGTISTLVEVSGKRFSRLERYWSSWGGVAGCAPDAGVDYSVPLTQGLRREFDLDFSPTTSLVVNYPPAWLGGADPYVSWLSMPDGGLTVVTFDADAGQFAAQVIAVPFPIRKASANGAYALAVFNDKQIAVLLDDAGWDIAPLLPEDAGIIQAVTADYSTLTVLTGQVQEFSLDVSEPPFAAAGTGDWVENYAECQLLCADGRIPNQTRDLGAVPFAGYEGYLVSCLPSFDGGNGLEEVWYSPLEDGGCETRSGIPPGTFSVMQQPIVLADGDPLNGYGFNVLAEPTSNLLEVTANGYTQMMLARVPVVTVGPLGAPTAVTVDEGSTGDAIAAGYFALAEDAGFINVSDGTSEFWPVAAVDGRSSWAVFALDGGTLVDGGIEALVDTHGDGLLWSVRRVDVWARLTDPVVPDHVAVPPADAGTTVALLTSGDTLYYADLSRGPSADPSQAPRFKVATVPQVRSSVSALLAVAPSADATYSLGYLIANGRVYRVRADNPVVWRVDAPLVVADEAVSLWKDGARVRVGFGDGSVYGLPSGTRLAPPLMPGTTFVSDFADVCGSTFAAGRDGVYELIADGTSPVGTWQRVSTTASGPLLQPAAKLQSDGTGLLVYREHGVVERLTNVVCPVAP